MSTLTKSAEDLLDDLARALDVGEARYEAAERSYKSVCAWLQRPQSLFAAIDLEAYTQGSFRLGTAIRPLGGEDHYDLDIVCEFAVSKANRTQQSLHADLGHELGLYATAKGMQAPSPWRRCWTLNYADGAQFHMDILPSAPDGARQRALREAQLFALDYVDQAISITDEEHPNFWRLSEDWPASNPNGYAAWFHERMRPAFESRRRAMMLAEAKADVADIPSYRVKTPLQAAIQILKRHRDMRFSEEPDDRPTSIVITTLSAHAYQQEASVSGALLSILARMDQFIERRDGAHWIANPSDPRENFADAWNDDPALRGAFYDWLETARADFTLAARQTSLDGFVDTLAPRIGREFLERATSARRSSAQIVRAGGGRFRRLFDAPHRKPPGWPIIPNGAVEIMVATATRDGFRPVVMTSGGDPVAQGAKLRFNAKTTVPRPYRVYWQVVNTGEEARLKRQLRGGFDEVEVLPGVLSREEIARYAGSHSIECFIVKDGYLAARSNAFVVNIG